MGVKLSEQGKKIVNRALYDWHSTYENKVNPQTNKLRDAEECLAEKVSCDTKTVKRFIGGDAISDDYANAICSYLGLELEDVREVRIEEWRTICQEMLNERLALTTNLFTNQSGVIIEVKDVYTPLALVIKTKPDSEKKPEPSKQCQQGASQENGANQSQQEILQPISEDDFLEKLKSKTTEKSQGRRIAIIGEPGSGKTTRLQMLANWILKEQMGLPIWVSLADLGKRSLPEYLEQRWLQSCGKQKYWEDLQKQIDSGNVWLLLDGLDEWTQQVGNLVDERLLTGAIGKARMVITCRSNVWDDEINALSGFDVFRNREFEPEQVKEYIDKWFQAAGKPDGGERLLTKLREPGNERLCDLIRNPLRLSLLCATWYKTEEELPRTKAGLYQQFVKQIYRWKSDSLSTNPQEREEINQALARLAWEGMLAEEKGNTSRFRLKEGMVSNCLGNYFKKVLALGWINRIGEEKKADNTIEQVYAFYHATFQEYFAALYVPEWQDDQKRIPGWDYFMPRNHKGYPVPDKTYRIFDPRWKEVILFWLGRNDVSIDAKKAFLGVNSDAKKAFLGVNSATEPTGLEGLRDSGDGCGGFYEWQARFLQVQATAEVAYHKEEYQKSNNWFRAKELGDWLRAQVDWLVDAAFARDFSEDMIDFVGVPWCDRYPHDPVTKIARDSLAKADRTTIISVLVNLLNNCDTHLLHLILESLCKIGQGNELVIKTLTRLLEQLDIEINEINTLEKEIQILEEEIAIESNTIQSENPSDVQSVLSIPNFFDLHTEIIFTASSEERLRDLREHLSKHQPRIAYTLGIIDPGNQLAIQCLEKLLDTPGIDNDTLAEIAFYLDKIAPGNKLVIPSLVKLRCCSFENDSLYFQIDNYLDAIDPKDEFAIQSIVKLLDDSEDNKTRFGVALTLGNINPSNNELVIQSLEKLLAKLNLDDYTRSVTAWSLGRIDPGNQKAIQTLIQLLAKHDLDDYTRSVTAWSLGRIDPGNQKAIQTLIQLLAKHDLDDYTRRKAAWSLGEIGQGNPEAIQALLELLHNPDLDDYTRRKAAWSLGEIGQGNPEAIQALIQLLAKHDLDDYTRRQVIESLDMIDPGNPQAIQALTELLNNPEIDNLTRYLAAKSLVTIEPGNQKAIQTLIELLNNQVSISNRSAGFLSFFFLRDTCYLAAESLGEIGQGNPEVIQAFTELLNKPEIDNLTRYLAAKSLGRIAPGNPQAMQALIELLANPEIYGYDRREVIGSLGEIGQGNPEAIQALTELLDKPNLDNYTRREAAKSLGEIGQGNPEAIQALTELLDKPNLDNDTRREAAKSLGEIVEDATSDILVRVVSRLISRREDQGIYNILWKCAQKLPYEGSEGFYLAANLPTIQSSLKKEYDNANFIPIVINCFGLTSIADSDTLAARLSNRIFEALSLEPPEVKTVADLKGKLLQLKGDKRNIILGLLSQKPPDNVQRLLEGFGFVWLHHQHLSPTAIKKQMHQMISRLEEF